MTDSTPHVEGHNADEDSADINQAVGVLIGLGHLPEDAHEELSTQAHDESADLYGAATQFLRRLAPEVEAEHDPP